MRGLIIVAHPDDETMFCGGAMSQLKWDWTVVSAVHSLQSPRGQEFTRATTILKAIPIMLDVPYFGKDSLSPIDAHELQARLEKAVDLEDFDVIITHNSFGEFDNKDHIVINRLISRIAPKALWFFGFNCNSPDITIHLDRAAQSDKCDALAQYQSQRNRISLVEIRNAESFVVFRW